VSEIADWITAIGTACGAFATTAAVIIALRLASRDDARRRQEQTRHQAEQITAWLLPEREDDLNPGNYKIPTVIKNSSQELIYDVIANLVSIQGAFRDSAIGDFRPEYILYAGQVPPGEHPYEMNFGGRGMFLRFGVELAFRDAAGWYSLRRGNGYLEEIEKTPLALYGIDPPVPWESP
jgi:hypothetical protein